MFIHATVGRFLSLRGKHSSIVFASCSRKCISSYSMIVIFTFSVFFSPIWMSVPGGSPAFFDLFFVNFAIWTNLILDLRFQILWQCYSLKTHFAELRVSCHRGASAGHWANFCADLASILRLSMTAFAVATVHCGKGRSLRVKSLPASIYPSFKTRKYQPVLPVSLMRTTKSLTPHRRSSFQHGCLG